MSADLFDRLAERLEATTDLDRLQARGALRLALKEAGLDPAQLTRTYAAGVVERLLPDQLKSMGVAEGVSVCEGLSRELEHLDGGADEASRPESLFTRLGTG